MRARLAYAIRRVGAQAGSAKSEAQDSPFCGCSAGPLPAGYGASHESREAWRMAVNFCKSVMLVEDMPERERGGTGAAP